MGFIRNNLLGQRESHVDGAYNKQEVEQSIADRFEYIVREFPERIAIKTKTGSLTYKELNDLADGVAQAILASRGPGNEPIPLLMDSDFGLFYTILGILKSGKCYVPLDPLHPKARIVHILDDCGAPVLLTNERNQSLAIDVASNHVQVINVDTMDFGPKTETHLITRASDVLAYIIYTSGSTGAPKGVMQTHRNVLHKVMEYTDSWQICLDDRLALLYSHSTSGAVRDIFTALLNGACLCPFNVRADGIPRLVEWLIDEEITIYNSAASLFRQFVGSLTGREVFAKLRLIHVGSEAIYRKEVEQYQRYFSDNCKFVARYGTSEISPICQFVIDKKNELSEGIMPLGHVALDSEVILFNDEDKDVGVNQIGEIAVRSRYLSPGYWQKPDLTRNAFLPGPDGEHDRIFRTGDLGRRRQNGCIEYLGRKDFRVKIRGFTVEVGEIEKALVEHPDISECVVVSNRDKFGDQQLIAYIVLNNRTRLIISEVRRFLRITLPDHMVPSSFVILHSMPLTPNGKVDRLALPDPGRSRPDLDQPYVPPRTPGERQLAEIWAEILGIDQVGIHDGFLELGGNSLAAIQVISRVITAFQVELPLRSLLESSTVTEMAQRIETFLSASKDLRDHSGARVSNREVGEL